MAAVLFFTSTKRNSARWLLLSLFFAGNFNLPPAAAACYWSWTTLGWSPAQGILCFNWSLLWYDFIIDLLSRLKMCVLGAMFIKLISLFLCMYFNISMTFACNRCSSLYNKCSNTCKHITSSVRLAGPFSCFGTEGWNGTMMKLIHGTHHVAIQVEIHVWQYCIIWYFD